MLVARVGRELYIPAMLHATIRRPSLSIDDAAGIAARHFGLDGEIDELPSERDRNYRIVTAGGDAFVLKVSREGEDLTQLRCENAALIWVADRAPTVPVPRVLSADGARDILTVSGRDGTEYLARCLTYLPGRVLAESSPHSTSLLRSLGTSLADLDLALADFHHPAASRAFIWDLARAPTTIREHRDSVAGRERNAVIDLVLERWTEYVEPHAGDFRRSVIYNDANDHNILVDLTGSEPRRVTGFIDFGDMVESYTVCDVAIAIAYAMLGKDDPLTTAATVAAAYHTAHPLRDAEVDAIIPMACARLATSVCLSAARQAAHPDDGYLRISEDAAWTALSRLAEIDAQFARAFLRVRVGLPALPSTVALHEWLNERRGDFESVVDPDPRSVPSTVLDLSVGSPLLADPGQLAATPALSALLFEEMARRHATVGIGRYNEPRLWYASEAFRDRTVHLAVDLFLPAGTPVRAPLDGTVDSVQDNAAALDYGPTVIVRHEPRDGPRFFTLYGHLHRSVLARLSPGDTITAGHQFAELGTFDANGQWPPHLHFQIITDLLGLSGDFPGVAQPDERDIWTALCPDPNLILGLEGDIRYHDDATPVLLERRYQRLSPSLSLAYADPLNIVRGRGAYLYDAEGRGYLDCVNNVCHVGHCHPKVVDAVQRQVSVLNTNTRYLHDNILRYAEELTEMLPAPLNVCFFVNSGSEANDLALRIARTATGSNDILVIEGAYHGHTNALIDASPYKYAGPGGTGRAKHVRAVPMPDRYRGLHRDGNAEDYASHLGTAIDALRDAGRAPAAFIAESLLSCGGQIEPPSGFLRLAFDQARTAGAVCIADEVQVGFGRVGTHFWGFETQDAVPDIVTMGKPIGNGHPLGAVVTTRELADVFANGMEYFNTFGGNPVSCAAGLAVLEVIREERLQEHARTVGQDLLTELAELADRHPIIGDVRGRGLFIGIELVRDRDARTPAPEQAGYVIERMKEERILLSTDGPDNNVLKFKPPLVFGIVDRDRFVATLDRVLGEDFAQVG